MVTAIVLAGTLSIVQTWVAALLTPDTGLLTEGDPGGTAFYHAASVAGGQWLSVLTAVTTAVAWGFANALVAQVATSRLLFAMAWDGQLPRFLAKVSRTAACLSGPSSSSPPCRWSRRLPGEPGRRHHPRVHARELRGRVSAPPPVGQQPLLRHHRRDCSVLRHVVVPALRIADHRLRHRQGQRRGPDARPGVAGARRARPHLLTAAAERSCGRGPRP